MHCVHIVISLECFAKVTTLSWTAPPGTRLIGLIRPVIHVLRHSHYSMIHEALSVFLVAYESTRKPWPRPSVVFWVIRQNKYNILIHTILFILLLLNITKRVNVIYYKFILLFLFVKLKTRLNVSQDRRVTVGATRDHLPPTP